MRDRVLLLRRHLPERARVAVRDEDRVPAEAVRAARLGSDRAGDAPLDDERAVRRADAEDAHRDDGAIAWTVDRAADRGEPSELLPELDERPREAAERAELDPGVLDDDRPPEAGERGARLLERDVGGAGGLHLRQIDLRALE